ncbi:MAG: hypothetical protein AUG44_25060 [Actinobacteria bacterium 13_1_20CM_3_71_11]|nr:MAG: hypothetical protein AUG44_25060 [Actinobacteria bacterium 13_1_20CM_3_71_11]
MQRLARVNGTQAFLGALALVVIGLVVPGWYGAVLLFALVALLLVVLVQTAPGSSAGTVGVRLVILAGIVAIALSKVL